MLTVADNGPSWHDVLKGTKGSLQGCHPFAGMQVAQHLMGCSQSLQAVTQHVLSIYSMNGQDENLTETAVRNLIIDLAARKSFAAKDSEFLVFTANTSVQSLRPVSVVLHHTLFRLEIAWFLPCVTGYII